MTQYPPVFVLRHGETEWNAQGRMQGAMDSPLTAAGMAQARVQGRILHKAGAAEWAWYSSPQGRAAATARLARGSRRGITSDPRLAEITIGTWTGRARSDIMAEAPHLFEDDDLGWYDHAPGGEGLEALFQRTRTFLDDLTAPSVIVTHGITSRVLRCHLSGRDWTAFWDMDGGQGCVYHLDGGVQTKLTEEDA